MERATVIIGGTDGAGGCLVKGDRAALELAIDRFPATPHVYCVARDEAAFRYAAAAGAERVALLSDLDTIDSPPVLLGPASLGRFGDWLPAVLAERLAAALVFEVLNIVAADEDSQVAHPTWNDALRSADFQSARPEFAMGRHGLEIRATGQLSSDDPLVLVRDLGHGERDELEVRGPAVLVISGNATPRRYVSHYRQRFAPISLPTTDARGVVDPLNELGGVWGPMHPRVRAGENTQVMTLSTEDRVNTYCGVQIGGSSENERGRPIQADAATCAAHLLRYLSHHGFLPDGVAATVPRGATAALESVEEPHGPVVAGARSRALDNGGPRTESSELESASNESGALNQCDMARGRRPRLPEGNDSVHQRRQPRLLSPSSESGGDCALNGAASRTSAAVGNELSAHETTHDAPLTTHNSPLTPDDSPLTIDASPPPRPIPAEGSPTDA